MFYHWAWNWRTKKRCWWCFVPDHTAAYALWNLCRDCYMTCFLRSLKWSARVRFIKVYVTSQCSWAEWVGHHLNGERRDTSVIKIYQDISRYIKIYQDTAWQDMARLKDQDRPSMFHDSSIWAFSTTKTQNRTTTGRKNERHVCHMSLARLLAAAFPTGHAEELGPSRPGIAFRIDCEHLWTS